MTNIRIINNIIKDTEIKSIIQELFEILFLMILLLFIIYKLITTKNYRKIYFISLLYVLFILVDNLLLK